MKTTKIKQIPMFPTRYYDPDDGWTYFDVLSHADYVGQTFWSDQRTKDGRTIQIEPVMIDNVPWYDTLTYVGFYRGRSAAGMNFENDKHQQFTVFMKDMDSFIPLMVKGVIEGNFIYCKRGRNYGVTLFTGEMK